MTRYSVPCLHYKEDTVTRQVRSAKWNQGGTVIPLDRVLGEIFVAKRDEVTWRWGKLHNEELLDLYCSSSTIRIIK
jgi:hypothetical protein